MKFVVADSCTSIPYIEGSFSSALRRVDKLLREYKNYDEFVYISFCSIEGSDKYPYARLIEMFRNR